MNSVRGAFRVGRKEIQLAIPVTADMLRGSGLPIRPAVAAALGVNPGQRRVFTSPHGQVPVMWRMSSTSGPSIGSLRAHTMATGANLQDTLVLIFSLDEASLNVTRIDAEVAGIQRLRLILGRAVRKPAAALAASLNCQQPDVAAVLRKRGDDDLADLAEL
jgi:hypothetical protein